MLSCFCPLHQYKLLHFSVLLFTITAIPVYYKYTRGTTGFRGNNLASMMKFDDDTNIGYIPSNILGIDKTTNITSISTDPFKSSIELGSLDWISHGSFKSCGDFWDKRELNVSLYSFSHKIQWVKMRLNHHRLAASLIILCLCYKMYFDAGSNSIGLTFEGKIQTSDLGSIQKQRYSVRYILSTPMTW